MLNNLSTGCQPPHQARAIDKFLVGVFVTLVWGSRRSRTVDY